MSESPKIINKFPHGVVEIPPSKSISHRAAICAELAGGELAGAIVHNLGDSDDIRATVAGIRKIAAVLHNNSFGKANSLGEQYSPDCHVADAPRNDSKNFGDAQSEERKDCHVADAPRNDSKTINTDDARTIDCAESGSTLRFLIPLAAVAGGEWTFVGRGRLFERPQSVYDEVFKENGGEGAYFIQEKDKIRVRGPLLPVEHSYSLPGNVSSQFISGLLFALPLLQYEEGVGAVSTIETTSPLESADYVNLTIDVLRAFGIEIRPFGKYYREIHPPRRIPMQWEIKCNQKYKPTEFTVEGDWSQAAFFLCAAALGCDVHVAGLKEDSLQGDRRVREILGGMGANVSFVYDGEYRVSVSAPNGGLRGAGEIDVRDIPDIVPPLAALACYANGLTVFTNVGRLRMKESDRIAALVEELSKLGAEIKTSGDNLLIYGVGDGRTLLGNRLNGGDVDAHGDHRIAMALAVAAIGCREPVQLTGRESVSKSYPNFWRDFERIPH